MVVGTGYYLCFPDGQTQDQFVWSKKITATTVDVTGLQMVQLSWRDFYNRSLSVWSDTLLSSFGPVGCKGTTLVLVNPKLKRQTKYNYSKKTTPTKITQNKSKQLKSNILINSTRRKR